MRAVRFTLIALAFLFSLATMAQENPPPPWKGEAEAGAIIVSGNNDSESYNAKAKTEYTIEKNLYAAFGRYLKTNSLGVESARNWEIGVRYEHQLADYLSVYVGQKAESDIFNGYLQRDSTDAGLKYFLVKTDETKWTLEAGYRYQKTLPTAGGTLHDNLGRVYSEYNRTLDKTLSFKYWAEYLPNFTEPDAYLANTEASLNIMLNSIFSLKLAYLLQYQNVPSVSGKYTTTTTTMNLVAKF
ncbi:DUF481 domain-containing protein [Bdellovibrio sp. ArHS]|uniref:DUF481 domain-containing protein n=1 Tax=Bdellovibrio sp. ArHS TaxID=1569284 RepID=UPI000B22C678|nr:DUF481 domain-containing protein [Bdellovibrio sp. ArHS]